MPLFDAAKVCNCTPWELLAQPTWWLDWALAYARAHRWAEDVNARRQQSADRRQSGGGSGRRGLRLTRPEG